MTPTPTRTNILPVIGVLMTGAALTSLGGLPGLAWTLAVAATAYWLPLPFAVFLGQFGLAAVTTALDPLLLLGELGLLTTLTSDLTTAPPPALIAGLTTMLATASLALLLRDTTAWLTALTILTTLTLLLYSGHRYELLKTDQIPS